MRLVAVAIVLAWTTARADEPVVQAMQRMTDDAAYCEGMRRAWSNDAASCARVSTRIVRGVGTAEAWQAATDGEAHWTLMIRTAHGLWMSPELSLPGDQCGAGHCLEIEASPVLHVIHPRGRTAVALELRTVERWSLNEGGAKPYRSGTGSTFIVCGDVAGGELRCRILGGRNDEEACTSRLADDGQIARTCRATQQVELSP
jgi:hypothetical protein